MSNKKPPVTAAVRVLRAQNVEFSEHLFTYQEKGGTGHAAAVLGITEHKIIKTLIMENDQKQPLIVLMHGDCQVSTKQLARTLGVKSITSCNPRIADKYSGYQVGGTSPFGIRYNMPIFIEATILELSNLYINGGKRGYMLQMRPADLQQVLQATPVQVAVKN